LPEPASDAVSIGVVVVAYRSAPTIGACVRSCLVDPHVAALVVVDNSADPATEEAVHQTGDPRVVYRVSPNLGFAVGCNTGVAELPGDVTWVAFVNPDVELERPLSTLVGRPEVATAGVVGAHVESPRSPGVPSARRAVTVRRELAKAVVGSRAYAMKPLGDIPVRVDQVSGALLMVRRADLERLGGFDERFELYYEDVDLCVRAAELGGCVFVPTRWGRHVGGASAARAGERAYVAGRVSRMRYLRKHRPGAVTEASLGAMAGLEALTRSVARGVEGRRGRVQGLRAQWREWRSPGSVRSLR
jgi:N-acetylglucosaminyl-diphospho-decaprenol L-rhamnosyltransferase